MGSSASKAARKLSKRVETPSWAGARTPSASDAIASYAERAIPQRPRASEIKTEDIQRDSQDPDFMAKLARLGQVKVDHHMQPVRPVPNATRIFNSRRQSEEDSTSTHGIAPANRLPAYALSELLNARKSVTTRAALDSLLATYNIDADKLELLTRTVSTPSVDPSSCVKKVDKGGDETVSMIAVWVEPPVRGI